jgi:lipopolysaccharide heptosyltransferase II
MVLGASEVEEPALLSLAANQSKNQQPLLNITLQRRRGDMTQSQFSNINRILIRSANWVGDAVMTTPSVAIIRRNFPGAHITLLAKPWVLPVFENNPHVNALMVYDAAGRHRNALGILRLARDLKTRRFDLAILFQNAFEAAWIAWLAGIPRRLGFTTDGRDLLLTHRVRTWHALKNGHLVDYYIGLLTGAGLKKDGRIPALYLTEAEGLEARQRIGALTAGKNDLIIGINPGATYGTAKRWPAERFVELSRRFIEGHGAHILIFGGPGEAALGRQMTAQIGAGCTNLCNQTSLREAMAAIQCCHGFVTNDSGLMHVAAALNIPTVAIIGPTDVTATGPINPKSRLVRANGSCRRAPCLLPHCPIDHRCMTGIDVDRVFQATLAMIQKVEIG